MKKAFSMIITTVFIVVMSIIGIMILKFSSASTMHSTRSFMDTRAELMLRSATEFSIMAMNAHKFDSTNKCLNSMNYIDGDRLFDINITYHYFVTDCNTSNVWDGCRCSTIQTADTNGSVLVYVTVTSRNPNFHIRKTRFTLQNP